MGSGSSKSRRMGGGSAGGLGSSSSFSPSFSSTAGGSRRVSRGWSVLRSSCLGLSSRAFDSDDEGQVFHQHDGDTGGLGYGPRIHHAEPESDEVKIDDYRKLKVEQPDAMSCVSSNIELRECGQASSVNDVRGAVASSGRSLNHSGQFLSPFSFVPGNVRFRLSRATSLGSDRAYPVSPMSFTISSNEEPHLTSDHPSALVHKNENQQGHSLRSAHSSCTSPRRSYDIGSVNLRQNFPSSSVPRTSQDSQILSDQGLVVDNDCDNRTGIDAFAHPLGSHAEMDDLNSRTLNHRNGIREQPGDHNVQFSRTLSVGRLRDRVQRHSSFSDMTFSPVQQERELGNSSQGCSRQVSVNQTGTVAFEENAMNSLSPSYLLSNMSGSFYGSQSHDVGMLQSREAMHNDLLEQRSNFLERRRRIRTQVRALQRLGSRFESPSGHERSCILSGQHRSGRCTCHVNIRDFNSNDDNGARASISRIVMLAEALFEVLDEIHQQSVVLSSRPSVSSIGSVPAPDEVVESLPIKIYCKSMKPQNEEVPQCYICLVEYEEGDNLRILSCNHEFHKTCIDKWLKEIHRVCPLCRRDICRPDSLCGA